MTLQNGLIHKRRAYLWTDTAISDPSTGAIVGEVSKVAVGLAWPWAAVHSGEMLSADPQRWARHLGEIAPMSEAALIEACGTVLREEAGAGRVGRLLVAYACRSEGARMFFMSTDHTAAGAALVAHPVFQHACCGAGHAWNNRFAAEHFTLDDMRSFVDAQLQEPMQTVYGFPARFGGNLIEVRVTEKGFRPTLRRAISR